MASAFRLKRRAVGGAAGPPPSLLSGQLAFNEQDGTLYYGKGDNGSGGATMIVAIGGTAYSGQTAGDQMALTAALAIALG